MSAYWCLFVLFPALFTCWCFWAYPRQSRMCASVLRLVCLLAVCRVWGWCTASYLRVYALCCSGVVIKRPEKRTVVKKYF